MQHLWTPWRMTYLTGEKAAGCIFCQKTAEQADDANYIVYRGSKSFLILNLYPYNNGHLMAVPYRHVATLEHLNAEELLDLMQMANLGLAALRTVMSPEGFNLGVNLGKAAGAGVDSHVHVHIVPRWQGDTNFMPLFADARVIPETLPDTYHKLKQAIAALSPEAKNCG